MTIKRLPLAALIAVVLVAARPAQAENCYTLKNARGETVYNSEKPPFDLSYPPFSKEYDAARARGEVLMIASDTDCYSPEKFAEQKRQAKAIAWERANTPAVDYAEGNQASRRPASRPSAAPSSSPAPAPQAAAPEPSPALQAVPVPVVVLPPPTPTYFLNSMSPQPYPPASAPVPPRSFSISDK